MAHTFARTNQRLHGNIPLAGSPGIWVLVLGDMTVFAMFLATFMSRGTNPCTFPRDYANLSATLGTANAVLLLTSSLFVALAVQRV